MVGAFLVLASVVVWAWSVAGLVSPAWARLPGRLAAVGVWIVAVLMLGVGAALMPEDGPAPADPKPELDRSLQAARSELVTLRSQWVWLKPECERSRERRGMSVESFRRDYNDRISSIDAAVARIDRGGLESADVFFEYAYADGTPAESTVDSIIDSAQVLAALCPHLPGWRIPGWREPGRWEQPRISDSP